MHDFLVSHIEWVLVVIANLSVSAGYAIYLVRSKVDARQAESIAKAIIEEHTRYCPFQTSMSESEGKVIETRLASLEKRFENIEAKIDKMRGDIVALYAYRGRTQE